MALHKAVCKCFDGVRLWNEGDVFDYSGAPNKNLVRVDSEESETVAVPDDSGEGRPKRGVKLRRTANAG